VAFAVFFRVHSRPARQSRRGAFLSQKENDMITTEQVGGIVRALVAAAGGYFVGQGLIDAETAVTVGGAVTTLAVALWSIYSKRKA
jgi:hypothetical protein